MIFDCLQRNINNKLNMGIIMKNFIKKNKKNIITFLASGILFSACSSFKKTDVSMDTNIKKPVVIQGAMDVETNYLISKLNDPQEIKIGPWSFHKGTVLDYPVIISQTHVGMTNAAAVTALAIERFNPIAIINQGVAGGHTAKLKPYDIILGTTSVNYGAIKTLFKAEGKGTDLKNWDKMETEVPTIAGNVVKKDSFTGNNELLKIAESLKNTYVKGKIVEGVIGSADQWNREIDKILWTNETYKTLSEDMETASAAQIAYSFDIPFLGIRILSNNELNDKTYHRDAGIDCQKYVIEILKRYISQLKENLHH